MKSDRTQICKKRWIIFTVVSFCLWVGAALFAAISAFSKGTGAAAAQEILSEDLKAKLVTMATTLIICLILVIFMGNKMRMTVWMASVILSTIIYGEVAMYIIFSLWFIDEYVIHYLAKHYKNKYNINKEIDLRD